MACVASCCHKFLAGLTAKFEQRVDEYNSRSGNPIPDRFGINTMFVGNESTTKKTLAYHRVRTTSNILENRPKGDAMQNSYRQ